MSINMIFLLLLTIVSADTKVSMKTPHFPEPEAELVTAGHHTYIKLHQFQCI